MFFFGLKEQVEILDHSQQHKEADFSSLPPLPVGCLYKFHHYFHPPNDRQRSPDFEVEASVVDLGLLLDMKLLMTFFLVHNLNIKGNHGE